MTKITSVLDRIARGCSLTAPSSWLTATNVTAKEIRDDFLLETVDDVHARIDFASPIGKQTTITGDGSVNYALPSNFVRLVNDTGAIYETASVRRVGSPINSDSEWTHINELGTGAGSRYYRVKGYEGNFTIDFYPTPVAGDSITVSYVSSVWMASSGGTEGSAFTDADDVTIIPRRILETGTIWRFRSRKGLPYEDHLAQYEELLASVANKSRARGVIRFGDGPARSPFDIPVPDYIPSS